MDILEASNNLDYTPQAEVDVKKLKEKLRDLQRIRKIFERQWLINISFLIGKHYFAAVTRQTIQNLDSYITTELRSESKRNKERRTANYSYALYRALKSRFMQMKASVVVTSISDKIVDKDQAKLQQSILTDFWENVNKNDKYLSDKYTGMQLIISKLIDYTLLFGVGFLKVYFNPDIETKKYIGEVVVDVLNPFQVYFDRDNKFYFEERTMNKDDVFIKYNVRVKGQDLTMTESERQLLYLYGGAQEDYLMKDNVRVYEYWEKPCLQYPQGIHVIFTEETVLLTEAFPEEYNNSFPYIRFNYLDLPLMQYPQGFLEQLIPLQEEYNYTISRIYSYKKNFAGKYMMPDGCKLKDAPNDEIGQVMWYSGTKPEYVAPPPVPQSLFNELDRIRRDMEDVAAVHEPSMGRMTSTNQSGIAIENLIDQDNTTMMPFLLSFEQNLELFSEMTLQIISKKYNEQRLFDNTNKFYVGTDLQQIHKIKVVFGSSMPFTKQAKQQYIFGLLKMGIIDQRRAKEMLDLDDTSQIEGGIDREQAERENALMMEGNRIVPMDIEDHNIHMEEHIKFMKQYYRDMSPEQQQNFDEHHQLTLELMNNMSTAQDGGMTRPSPQSKGNFGDVNPEQSGIGESPTLGSATQPLYNQ